MLNKLRCHAHFHFSASQITWSRLLIQIQEAGFLPTDLDLHCMQTQGISGFSREKVKKQILLTTWTTSLVGMRGGEWAGGKQPWEIPDQEFSHNEIQVN